MARTPLAARILIDPAFSDGYESNQPGELGGHSLVEAEVQSPIDLASRTPTHIRFAESGQSQLVEHPAADRSNRDFGSHSSQRTAISDMADEISRQRSEISEMRRLSPAGEISPKWWNNRIKDGFKWADRPRGIKRDSAK